MIHTERLTKSFVSKKETVEAVKGVDIDVIARGIDPKKLGRDEFADLLDALGALADSGADLDLAKMDPGNFARIISRASKDQIESVTSRPGLRERVLDEVFRRMEVHFRSERAGATRAVVQEFLAARLAGDTERLVALFADEVNWVLAENPAAQWVRPRSTAKECAAQFTELMEYTVPEDARASVDTFLVDGPDAVHIRGIAKEELDRERPYSA